METIFIIIVVLVVIGALIFSSQKDKSELETLKIRSQDIKAKSDENYRTTIIPAYNAARMELINKYGNPKKAFVLGKYNLNKEIIAFEESNRIWICGNDYPMKSILSCTFTDDKKVIKGEITSTTKTNTGNMVKRAVVGDVLLGDAGAIIGGSTASKTTITAQGQDKIIHNYTIIINVDSLSEPTIKIPMGTDENTVNEIVGLMNVIINRCYSYTMNYR